MKLFGTEQFPFLFYFFLLKKGLQNREMSTRVTARTEEMGIPPVNLQDLHQKAEASRNKEEPPITSLKECIFSWPYISHIIWFCLLHLRNNVFMGTIVPWLSDIYPHDGDKGMGIVLYIVLYYNVLHCFVLYIVLCCILYCILY